MNDEIDNNESETDELTEEINDLLDGLGDESEGDMVESESEIPMAADPAPAPDPAPALAEPVAAVAQQEASIVKIPSETRTVPASQIAGEKRIPIVIHEGNETDSPDVFVSVNGKTFQIKRGVQVNVPQCVIDVLDNAIGSKLVKHSDRGEYELVDKPRFSYQRLSE